MARALALALASVYASGCMTLGLAVRPKDTPASHPIVGGLIGDVSIGAGASLVQSHFGDDDAEPHPYLWAWLGGVILVDAITVALVYRHQQQHPPVY